VSQRSTTNVKPIKSSETREGTGHRIFNRPDQDRDLGAASRRR